jgi:hypothetical protein
MWLNDHFPYAPAFLHEKFGRGKLESRSSDVSLRGQDLQRPTNLITNQRREVEAATNAVAREYSPGAQVDADAHAPRWCECVHDVRARPRAAAVVIVVLVTEC